MTSLKNEIEDLKKEGETKSQKDKQRYLQHENLHLKKFQLWLRFKDPNKWHYQIY